MNEIFQKAKYNFMYTLISQIIVAMYGILKALVLPILIESVEEYAYWQMYLFYFSYVLVFSFGFHEGIYLRYGHLDEGKMPYDILGSAIKFQTIILLLSTVMSLIAVMQIDDINKRYTMILVVVNIIISGVSEIYYKLYQCNNQMKLYSIYILLDKILFVPGVIAVYFILDMTCFALMIVDIICKIVVVFMLIVKKKNIFCCTVKWRRGIKEWYENISSGSKILISNYLAILVLGIGRIVIEYVGSLKDYAYYSFAITIANILVIFIGAVNTVLFPTIKRINEESYPNMYGFILRILLVISTWLLVLYYPAKCFVIQLIPQYSPSISILPLFFIIVIVSGVDGICNTTFLKAKREETYIFRNNLFCIVFFCVVCFVLYLNMNRTIECMAVVTFISIFYKYLMAKRYTESLLQISNKRETVVVVCIMVLFIIEVMVTNNIVYGVLIQCLIAILVSFIYKNELLKFVGMLRNKF